MTTPPSRPRYNPPGTRGVSLRASPTVSVVIASRGPLDVLAACLASFAAQARRHDAEIVVVRADGDQEQLLAAYPGVRFVAAEAGSDLPALRELGLTAAVGDIVAITDDDCLARGEWLDRLVTAGTAETTRPTSIPRRSPVNGTDWAAYLAEHGVPDPGAEARVVTRAVPPGKPTVLGDVVALAAAGTWELLMHPESGPYRAPPQATPALTTGRIAAGLRRFCQDRFFHGRVYAGRQARERTGAHRWIGFAGALLLPFARAWPVTQAVNRRRPQPRLLVLPLVLAVVGSWALGEACGCLLGPDPSDRG